MSGFAGHAARNTATAIAPKEYDEVAAKRVERELVELGGRLGDARSSLAWLSGALDQAPCDELLGRMEQGVSDIEADLSRLMCEAKKQLRGSDD
jgi:hypothetical protein